MGSFIDTISMMIREELILALVVIFEISLLLFYNGYKVFKLYKLSLRLHKTPFYNQALVGMYVKLVGRVGSLNRLKTPLLNTKCEFYNFVVKGLWQTKRKKPSKGYKLSSKTIYQKVSPEFLLQNDTKKVYIKVETEKNSVKFDIKDESKITTTSIPNIPTTKKYKNYQCRSLFLQEGDKITVYGRLIKKEDRYIITNTYSKKLPFILFSGDYTSFGKFYNGSFFYRTVLILSYLLLLYNIDMVINYEIFFLIFLVVYNFSGSFMMKFLKRKGT